MPFRMIRGDIVTYKADAIVNAANPALVAGGGVCGAIFAAAGAAELQAACDRIGGCAVGDAVVTPGFRLPARYVIHTAGPVWAGGEHGEAKLLAACYTNALARAVELNLESVAFPLISAGIYGYPAEQALHVAVAAIGAFLLTHEDMDVTLLIYDPQQGRPTGPWNQEIARYLSDSYQPDTPAAFAGRLPLWPDLAAQTVAGTPAHPETAAETPASNPVAGIREPAPADNAMPPIAPTQPSTPAQRPMASAGETAEPSQPQRVRHAARQRRVGWLHRLLKLRARRGAAPSGAFEALVQTCREEQQAEREQADLAAAECASRRVKPESGDVPAAPYAMPEPPANAVQAPASGADTPAASAPDIAPEPADECSLRVAQAPDLRLISGESTARARRPADESDRVGAPRRTLSMKPRQFTGTVNAAASERSLSAAVNHLSDTFSQSVLHWIDRKGYRDVDIYKRANLDRKLFSKLRSDRSYQPSKQTALALCIALRLNLDETHDLLARAGYALSACNKADLISAYFIAHQKWDIFELNEALFSFEQPCLGA